MSLRTRIAASDCIEQYAKAAEEHQEAGLLLLSSGSAQGVAMMALSAEMILKAAYFRFIGHTLTQSIEKNHLMDAQADARSLGVLQSPQGYHNLIFWADVLVAVHRQGLPGRTYQARHYPPVPAQPLLAADEHTLQQCAARLTTNWEIGIRYRSLTPYAHKQDIEDVFDDAVEIKHLYDQGRI